MVSGVQHARHLESIGEIAAAAKEYELSKTHRTEVPRMLFDMRRYADLNNYVDLKEDRVCTPPSLSCLPSPPSANSCVERAWNSAGADAVVGTVLREQERLPDGRAVLQRLWRRVVSRSCLLLQRRVCDGA